jgi:hypothetical protein
VGGRGRRQGQQGPQGCRRGAAVHSSAQGRRQGEEVAEGLGTQHKSETSKTCGLCTALLLDMFKSDPATNS